jgi:hypothetical protein
VSGYVCLVGKCHPAQATRHGYRKSGTTARVAFALWVGGRGVARRHFGRVRAPRRRRGSQWPPTPWALRRTCTPAGLSKPDDPPDVHTHQPIEAGRLGGRVRLPGDRCGSATARPCALSLRRLRRLTMRDATRCGRSPSREACVRPAPMPAPRTSGATARPDDDGATARPKDVRRRCPPRGRPAPGPGMGPGDRRGLPAGRPSVIGQGQTVDFSGVLMEDENRSRKAWPTRQENPCR